MRRRNIPMAAEKIAEDVLRRRMYTVYKRSAGHISSGDLADQFRKYGVTPLRVGQIKRQDKWEEKLKAEVESEPRQPRKPRTKKVDTPAIRQRDKFNKALSLYKASGGTISKTTLSKKADVTTQTLGHWMRHPDWIAQTQGKEPEAKVSQPTTKPIQIRKIERFNEARQLWRDSNGNISNAKISRIMAERHPGEPKISPATMAVWRSKWLEEPEAPVTQEAKPEPIETRKPESFRVEPLAQDQASLAIKAITDIAERAMQQVIEALKK
jgi:hypothetical protein